MVNRANNGEDGKRSLKSFISKNCFNFTIQTYATALPLIVNGL